MKKKRKKNKIENKSRWKIKHEIIFINFFEKVKNINKNVFIGQNLDIIKIYNINIILSLNFEVLLT